MKKFMAMLLALVMTLSLAACGKKADDTTLYSGKVDLTTTKQANGTYTLEDSTRGGGIVTYDAKNKTTPSGKTAFTEAQYKSLTQLVGYLKQEYKVPMNNIVGHKDVAVPKGRKNDPASNFDWNRLRDGIS